MMGSRLFLLLSVFVVLSIHPFQPESLCAADLPSCPTGAAPSRKAEDYLFLLENQALVKSGSTVSGNLGVQRSGGQVMLGGGTFTLGTTIAADGVAFGPRVQVFDVAANSLYGNLDLATIAGTVTQPVPPPVYVTEPLVMPDPFDPANFPPAFPITCGGPAKFGGTGEGFTLPPGSYSDVVVGRRGKLILGPGTYNFCTLKAVRATIEVTGPATLNVRDRLKLGAQSRVEPVGNVRPSEVQVNLEGRQTVTIGYDSTFRARLFAPYAPLRIGSGALVTGRFVATSLLSDPGFTAVQCGDGAVQCGETCDPPGLPASPAGNLCRRDCTFCGDAIVQPGEDCDDGNLGGCRNDCTGPNPNPTRTPQPCGNPLLINTTLNATYPRGPEYAFPFGLLNYSDPATTLVMPFDVMDDDKTSFQMVSRIIAPDLDPVGSGTVATHWSYWSESCNHLADVFICLTPYDSVVVDPKAIQGELQIGATNVKTGPVIDLTGTRGFVTVSTYEADPAASTCQPLDRLAPLVDPTIVGSWTIGSAVHTGSMGGSAVGLTEFPDPQVLNGDPGFVGGITIQTFNPEILSHSRIILIGLQVQAGSGPSQDVEVGPIRQPLPTGTANVCCQASFVDNLENRISLPDVCFEGTGFESIATHTADPADHPIIPDSIPIGSPGVLDLSNCQTAEPDGSVVRIGEGEFPQFIIGFHGQTLP